MRQAWLGKIMRLLRVFASPGLRPRLPPAPPREQRVHQITASYQILGMGGRDTRLEHGSPIAETATGAMLLHAPPLPETHLTRLLLACLAGRSSGQKSAVCAARRREKRADDGDCPGGQLQAGTTSLTKEGEPSQPATDLRAMLAASPMQMRRHGTLARRGRGGGTKEEEEERRITRINATFVRRTSRQHVSLTTRERRGHAAARQDRRAGPGALKAVNHKSDDQNRLRAV